MSPEDYSAMREEAQGKTDTSQHTIPVPSTALSTSDVSARDFIMGRSKEIITVPINGPDGTMDIRIRARLTKREIKVHRKFLEMFKDPESISEDDADIGASRFLAAITQDPALDEEFWNSDEIDPYVAQELLTAFMMKAAESLEGVKKFRNNPGR